MEKPDIERIIYALDFHKSMNEFLIEYGEKIQKKAAEGLIELPDRGVLDKLLGEYNLERFLNDLYYMACLFKHDSIIANSDKISGIRYSESIKEMLQALKMLYEYNNEELKIEIKHKHINESVTIQQGQLIHAIAEAIRGEYLNDDEYILSGYVKPEEITGKAFGDYIGIVIDESESFRNKKGARKKHLMTGSIIDAMQRYLQNYTSLKAKEGIEISRGQALFIFDILEIIGMPQQVYHKERNIRHILNKYKAEQALKFPKDKKAQKKILDEWDEKQAGIISKLRDISKNK